MPSAAMDSVGMFAARHQFVQDDSNNEDAGPFTKRFLLPLFRGHIRACSTELIPLFSQVYATEVSDKRTQPEIVVRKSSEAFS